MPERQCVVCPVYGRQPREVERPMVCEGDRERLRTDLAEIIDLVALTPARIQIEPGNGPKVSGTRERPAPLNLTALGVEAPRYHRGLRSDGSIHGNVDDQIGIPQPVVTLDQWVTDWIDIRGRDEWAPPANLHEIVRWLDLRLDWACDEHPAIDEFATEVRDTVRHLRGITRDRERGESAGRCPARLRDDSRCDARLSVDPYVDKIQCPRCGSSWNRRDQGWLRLRAEQDSWESEAA